VHHALVPRKQPGCAGIVAAAMKTNFGVRIWRICHLKSPDHLGFLIVFFLRRQSSLQLNHGGIRMNNKLLNCLTAGMLVTALALASPALARGGGGGGGGHGGGFGGGGGHFGGGGMHSGGMGGGMHSGGAQFGGGRFAGAQFAHPGFAPRFAHAGFSPGFSRGAFHHRFHNRFNRFAFVGAPYAYASYDSCYRRVWTAYGLRWVDVCGYGGYGY